MKFVFGLVLVLIFASFGAANNIFEIGNKVELKCEDASLKSTTTEMESGWTSTNVYAVEVCSQSMNAAKACDAEAEKESVIPNSFVSLTINLKDSTDSITLTKEFNIKDLESKFEFCHIFKPCDFLPKLKGKDLTGSKLKAETLFVAKGEKSDVAYNPFVVIISATSYVVDRNEVKKTLEDTIPYSIVCINTECTIEVDPVSAPLFTETLTVVDGQAPQCGTSSKADSETEAKKLYMSVFGLQSEFAITGFPTTTPNPGDSTSEAFHIAGALGAVIATLLAFEV